MDEGHKTRICAAHNAILFRGQQPETPEERAQARLFWKPWRDARAARAQQRAQEARDRAEARLRTRAPVPPDDDLPVDQGPKQKNFQF